MFAHRVLPLSRVAILEIGFTRRIAELRGRLQRMDAVADPSGYQILFAELIALENRRRTLRDSA